MPDLNAPFPQANDFEKIVAIVNVIDESELKDYEIMQVHLGDISSRQVDYYVSACIYLGIINSEKKFTDIGHALRVLHGLEQIAELERLVVSDKIFGYVYFSQKLLGVPLEKEDVIQIMKRHISFNCEPMYVRRASTVISWIKWIISHEAPLV